MVPSSASRTTASGWRPRVECRRVTRHIARPATTGNGSIRARFVDTQRVCPGAFSARSTWLKFETTTEKRTCMIDSDGKTEALAMVEYLPAAGQRDLTAFVGTALKQHHVHQYLTIQDVSVLSGVSRGMLPDRKRPGHPWSRRATADLPGAWDLDVDPVQGFRHTRRRCEIRSARARDGRWPPGDEAGSLSIRRSNSCRLRTTAIPARDGTCAG